MCYNLNGVVTFPEILRYPELWPIVTEVSQEVNKAREEPIKEAACQKTLNEIRGKRG